MSAGDRRCRSCGACLARDNASAFCSPCDAARSETAAAPPDLPADFWNDRDLRTALTSRHMGRVIRAYRRHPHHGDALSQEDVATWAGLTQGQLSRIETGPPIQDLDRLIFWAQLLAIPERHLWFRLPEVERPAVERPLADLNVDLDLFPPQSRTGAYDSPRIGRVGHVGFVLDDDPLAAERAAALGTDLWELHDVLQSRRVSQSSLALAEEACTSLDTRYAELPPLVLLPELRHQLKHVVGWLQESQPVAFRQRLCSLAGRLAGLRAWLYFDMAEYQAADAWFAGAVTAAREADDRNLCGWLLGARSLIPVDHQDYASAAVLLEEAQAMARGASPTTRAWLDMLEARALAGLGDSRGFAACQQRATKPLTRTSLSERHHGMDFASEHLDLSYYEGLSLLLIGQSEAAGTAFGAALGNLPKTRLKARAILTLSIAVAAAEAQQLDEAVARAREALTIAGDQPIRRVWQRANEVRRAVEPARRSTAVRDFDEQLTVFAGSLERASSS